MKEKQNVIITRKNNIANSIQSTDEQLVTLGINGTQTGLLINVNYMYVLLEKSDVEYWYTGVIGRLKE